MALISNIKMEYMDSEIMPDAHNFSLEETVNALQTVYVCRSHNPMDGLIFSPLLSHNIKMEPTTDFDFGKEHYIGQMEQVNMGKEHYQGQMEQVNDYSHEDYEEPFDLELTPDQLEATFSIQPPIHVHKRKFKKQTKTKKSWQKNATQQRKVNSSKTDSRDKKSKNIHHKPNKSVIKKVQQNKMFGKTNKEKSVPKNGVQQRKVNSSKTDSRNKKSKNIHHKPNKSVIKKVQQNKMFGKTNKKKSVPKNGMRQRKVDSSKTDSRNNKSKNIHHKPNKSVIKKAQQNKTCGKTIKKNHVATKTAKQMVITSKKHQCELCNVIFPQKKMLVKHKKVHKKIRKTFPCITCKESFSDIISLLKHSRIHVIKTNCNVCSKSFNDAATFKEHKKTHMGEKPFKCDVCSKSFFNVTSLKSHGKSHLSKKLFQCDVCSKSFFNVTRLKSHGKSHLSKKLLVCDVCRKSFKNKMNLSDHMASHKTFDKNLESDPPKQASIEDKAHDIVDGASTSSTMLMPMIETTPKNSIVCGICNRSFKSCQSLTSHMRFHKNHRQKAASIEDKNVCDICSRSFKSCQGLKLHMRSHKTIDKKLETDPPEQASIEDKATTPSKNSIDCDICNRSVKSYQVLKLHMRSHKHLDKNLETEPSKPDSNEDKACDSVNGAPTPNQMLKPKIEAAPSKKSSDYDLIFHLRSNKIVDKTLESDPPKPDRIENKAHDIVDEASTSSTMLKPMIETTPKNSIVCGICNRSFKSCQSLTSHMKFHKNQRQKAASIEDKTDNKSTCGILKPLSNPPSSTLSRNPFKCNVCDKLFETKIALSLHLKTHKILNKSLENGPLKAAGNEAISCEILL
ncbi:zinc finger protein 37 homolog isoform X2 [Patella vulgata]|nr:zinc finger protein 37 homolog isoform X2 [Patella vulgata]